MGTGGKAQGEFKRIFEQLNEQQRTAVQTIEGPVLVVAGPGTGKTQVIATRIAYLLHTRETQIHPSTILCLTFSEAAAVNMRRRLLQIIGAAAHQITVETFHAFSNAVIQQNPELFGMHLLQPLTDLQRMQLLERILEELPSGHPLRNPRGMLTREVKKLGDLFTLMKRENWTPQHVSEAIDRYFASLPQRPEFVYQTNSRYGKKGELKQAAVAEAQQRMELLRAAAGLFFRYEELKQAAGAYDYEDMILWVIEAFSNNEELLRKYQERYQYVLVDEFQDTNGAQNRLLELLTSYWEVPNLFCVGDDDQGIYEFQGARLKNMTDFMVRYGQALVTVVLKHNYRSSQAILDTAARVIANNTQRLANIDERLAKHLVATAHSSPNIAPRVIQYANEHQEAVDILCQAEALHQQGVPWREMAVLYHRHQHSQLILELAQRKGIPVRVVRSTNAFQLPQVRQWIALLRYIASEWQHPYINASTLYLVLHQPWFSLHRADLARLAYFASLPEAKAKNWRHLLQDETFIGRLGLNDAAAVLAVFQHTEQWIAECSVLTVPILWERIVEEAGILRWALSQPDKHWHLQVLHTFHQFVQREAAASPDLTLSDLLDVIDQYERFELSLPVQDVLGDAEGILFSTCHSAKGLEFDYVFLIGCSSRGWEKAQKGGYQFALPDTLTFSVETNDVEALRRLFYVGCTRARKGLQISYAAQSDQGILQVPSLFVTETGLEVEERTVDADRTAHALSLLVTPPPLPSAARLEQQLVVDRLSSFVLSPSALAAYLDCPLRFYYEYIVTMPTATSESLEYGSAVHAALYRLFKTMKERNEQFPSLEEFLRFFDEEMERRRPYFTERQFRHRRDQGHMVLSAYYQRNISRWNKIVLLEYNLRNIQIDGVPVKGRIDKLEFQGHDLTVVDYKTGSLQRARQSGKLAVPSEKNPHGGDYWRQMVFYKLLLAEARTPWKMVAARFDFVDLPAGGTAEDFEDYLLTIDAAHERSVRELIVQTYDAIMSHRFYEGCGQSDCIYCAMFYDQAAHLAVGEQEYA
ncbi:MAG: ATP-dependent helicase [Chitinophagales bacterium]|nr:ATP-dependent helicase [Chitinophagales bacterium]MDW8427757.1 ATP-dependent DNA helicase [Chitinophagales bacterium]